MTQTTADPKQLSNEHVRVNVHLKPACIVEYEVEAFPSLVREAHKRATKAVAKEVSLPGFRKGRVPEELITRNFSKEIDKKWQEEIADEAFRQSHTLAQVPVLSRDSKISFRMKSYTTDKGAELTLSFETEPKIPSVDASQLELKEVKRPEVSEEKVSETIRQVQLFFATWTPITDRPVQKGDFVLLDVDIIEDTPPSSLFKGTRFEVAEKSMAQWMLNLVLGKQLEESVEGVSTPDADASKEDKEALGPKKVRLSIKAIQTPTMPAVDDAFAQMLGVPSVAELRTSLFKLLSEQADAHVQEALRAQASELLLTQYPFDLPPSLVEKETRFRLQQLVADPDFQQYWEKLPQEERKQMLQMTQTQAEKAVRMFYLCRRIVADAKIKISAEDLPKSPTTPLEALLFPQKLYHHQKNPEIQHAEAFSRLLLEKAEDWVIAHAVKKSAS